jgi:AraC-like DNA-binding protein
MTTRTIDMTDRPETQRGGDVLSEVLRAVRLRGAAYFSVDASSPWVAEAPPARELAPYVMPGAEHVIEYHVVTSGSCYGGLIGEPAVLMHEGDIIVFPQGDPHVMSSASGMRAPADFALHERASRHRLPVTVDIGNSGREPCHLICGFLACDARPFNPLLTALPRLMHVTRAPGSQADMLDYFIKTALEESREHRSGGEVVLARLSELMFVEVVRRFVAALEPGPTSTPPTGTPNGAGWLSGLHDEVTGRALAALHARPAADWSLESLAREVAASRTALADRFVEHVGVPPMRYLAQWRMQLASNLLSGPMTMAQIAGEVGYGSEAAFSRAFKKIVGVAPAKWRARGQASASA